MALSLSYSTIKNHFCQQNNTVADNLLSYCAGYNYQMSNVNDGAQEGSDYVYTSGTDPSYTFDNKTQYITCGLGLRTGGFYIDAAFVHKNRESEFHAFSRYGLEPGEAYKLPLNAPIAPKATIKDNNNSIVLSVGYKF